MFIFLGLQLGSVPHHLKIIAQSRTHWLNYQQTNTPGPAAVFIRLLRLNRINLKMVNNEHDFLIWVQDKSRALQKCPYYLNFTLFFWILCVHESITEPITIITTELIKIWEVHLTLILSNILFTCKPLFNPEHQSEHTVWTVKHRGGSIMLSVFCFLFLQWGQGNWEKVKYRPMLEENQLEASTDLKLWIKPKLQPIQSNTESNWSFIARHQTGWSI